MKLGWQPAGSSLRKFAQFFASGPSPYVDARIAWRYTRKVFKSFRHAGLERFYLNGSKAGIHPAHAIRLENQLATLNRATSPSSMRIPGWNLHPLQGELAGHWAVKVSGNWRMTFRFEDQDAVLVDYRDYH